MIVNDIQITNADIWKLKPAKYNPRKMSGEALKRLKKSLQHFGTVDPLIVRKSDNMVIGGHQRLRAMQELGYITAPVVYIEVDDAQAKALNIQLNNPNSQGEWDEVALVGLLADLKIEIPDVEITGFDVPEIDKMIELQAEYDITEDEAPPLPDKPKSKLGELYQLGKHRLLCGDATKAEDVERRRETPE